MFSLLAIFSFIIVLFLASLKIIELVFANRGKFKSSYKKTFFTALALFLWFSFSAISTIFISSIVLKLPQMLFGNSQRANADVADVAIAKQDCQKLIDTIYNLENQIHQSENHRYIEESAPIFTIDLEYQKGSEKLNSVAEEYLALNVAENSQSYTKQMAAKLQEKAQLFHARTEIVENNQGVKEIINLLEEMDRVTEERQNMISGIKKQCQ
jgi:putative protein kinase ArgK-like GTPase of G3E family